MAVNPRAKMIDWKRVDKIGLRNFKDSVDFHDVVKTLLVRMLRRNYKDRRYNPIYTEFDPQKPNEDYPDVWMRDKKGQIYVWEIQKKITKDWIKQIQDKHDSVTVIIVDIKKVETKWSDRLMQNLVMNKTIDPMKDLRFVLEEYVI